VTFPFEDPAGRFVATVLVGVGTVFLVHLGVVVTGPGPTRWRWVSDLVFGLMSGIWMLQALETTTNLVFRFYVLLGLATGALLYLGLAAPALDFAADSLSRWLHRGRTSKGRASKKRRIL